MNRLRENINRQREINDGLAEQNDELRVQVEKLEEVEEGLSAIVTRQGRNVEAFVEAVKANQAVLDSMKDLIKAKILQDLVTVVLKADRDRNSKIDPGEIGMLVVLLKHAHGVTLNEERFRNKISENGDSIEAVLGACRDLLSAESDGSGIITVDPKKVHLSNMTDPIAMV
eukprot:CAMPEP_0197465204 /NCGR_PEP_ID=MMETSP1175-20131217/64416_1 /TAXON_ID=1003142 /ORGANISM="Triceratium dubium, Strain CCMP147" /LENGTH=170 /DNA_ID=CAMNT_0043001211 /DNA_START=1056 /DNA_END=1568 /DNA_ORIENTATION=+